MGAWTEVNVCGLYNVELQATGEVAGEGGAERERERSGRGGNKVGGDGAASAIVNESQYRASSTAMINTFLGPVKQREPKELAAARTE